MPSGRSGGGVLDVEAQEERKEEREERVGRREQRAALAASDPSVLQNGKKIGPER